MAQQQQAQQPEIDLSKPVTLTIDNPAITTFRETMPAALALAQAHTIVDEDSYQASETLIAIGTEAMAKIGAWFKDTKQAAFLAHRGLCKMENDLLQPFLDAEKLLASKRLAWRRKVEAENAAKEKEKEALLAKQHEEQAISEAAELQRMGQHEAAEEVIERAATAPAPQAIVAEKPMHAAGGRIGGKWIVRIDNPDEVQREYCEPSMKSIQKIVDALGKKHGIKGISIEWEEKESFSRKAKK